MALDGTEILIEAPIIYVFLFVIGAEDDPKK
jgi:hypothetical protein